MAVDGETYDVIVVGLGGHGSASLYHLAKKGAKVLGLEQYDVAHNKGSSHGESRIIRIAYHEHPDYVPLLQRAWQLWKELEEESQQFLLCDIGCIHTSDPEQNNGDNAFQNALLSATEHGLEHEILTGDECNQRYPGYNIPPHFKGLLSQGGILASERCIVAHISRAKKLGAEVHLGEKVLSWHAPKDGGIVTIITNKGIYKSKKVVFAGGAWMPHLVPELQTVLNVERNVIAWFEVLDETTCRKEQFPVCLIEGEKAHWYLFPVFEQPGLKIGLFDHLKERVDKPEKMRRAISKMDEKVLRDGIVDWFPTANGKMLNAAACMFTNTIDHHFIIDKHPVYSQVTLLSPCSGHGYKFCSVVGEIASDLALTGSSKMKIELCSINTERPGFDRLIERFHTNAKAPESKL